MSATTVDGTEMYYDAIRRIGELEQLNSLLAQQVDRMRPVIDAAKEFVNTGKVLGVHLAYSTYEKQMDELTGDVRP